MISIPINYGSLPNWNPQISAPELFNLFVDKDGYVNYTPSLTQVINLPNCRAMWETPYGGGSYIVVTDSGIYRTRTNGAQTLLYQILNSELPVEITENLQNEVTVCDGVYAYVIQQQSNDTVTVLGSDQGFALANPGSCCTINSFTVVLDTVTGIWQISNANDALTYDATAQQEIDAQLLVGIAVRELNNNLFIFGTGGIERWEPTLNVNIYLFPLQKDMNFKINYGAISTESVVSNANTIYFLSSRYLPMQLTSQGLEVLWPAAMGEGDRNLDANGIARELSLLPDVNDAIGSFYTFRGNLFYQLTFVASGVTWVWNDNSHTYFNTDDYIIGSSYKSEVVLLQNGLYVLSLTPATKQRYWISDTIDTNKGLMPNRGLLNGVELRQVQGAVQATVPEYVELSVSTNRQTFLNTVRIVMGQTGQFTYRTVWQTNISGQYFRFRIQYFGNYPFTIEKVIANLQ